MRVDKDGVVHFDTGGGNLGGHGDGSGEGGGYNDSGGGGDGSMGFGIEGGSYGGPDYGVSSVDAGYFTDPTAYSGYFGLDPDEASGLASTYSKQELANLSSSGYGTLTGLNKNNPTQSVDEMLAAQNVHNVLNYVAPAIASMVPGYGAISTIGRVGSGLLSGTMTPGQALSMGLAGALGAKTGLPSGIFEGLFEGNPGKAAGAGAQGGLAALTSALTGNPYAGAIAGATLGPSLSRSVSEAVGGSSTKGGGLAGMLDQGLGTSNWGGLLGGSSAPSQGSAPTGNASGDVGISPDTYAVLAAIEQAAQEPAQPAWERQTVAGRYGPVMNYEFGA